MLNVTVSGSFHRSMTEIARAVQQFNAEGVRVLSPACPQVVDHVGEFLFVASDLVRSVRLVQDRHLDSIRGSAFLWFIAPDGYVGQSASMELGFAVAAGIPILGRHLPLDLTLRQYVRLVPDVSSAIALANASGWTSGNAGFWIDPRTSIERAQYTLLRMQRSLAQSPAAVDDRAATALQKDRKHVLQLVGGGESRFSHM